MKSRQEVGAACYLPLPYSPVTHPNSAQDPQEREETNPSPETGTGLTMKARPGCGEGAASATS